MSEPQAKHWTLAEYYQLAEEGWFQGQRVQLIEGEIIQTPPQGHAHYKAIALISRWLQKFIDEGYPYEGVLGLDMDFRASVQRSLFL